MKRIGAAILAVALSIGFAACGKPANSGSQGNGGGLSSVEIWGAPGTAKILRDVHGIYDDVKTGAAVKVTAARGEYEGSHVILTAKADVSYDAASSQLKAADGTTFDASNVELFVEKYVRVAANFENNGMPVGDYPDALVPMDAIKKVGENEIAKGNNQGIYVRFNVPADQKPGTYTGSIALTVGKDKTNVPVTLNVVDALVSQENHMRSVFLNQWSLYKGELDTTQEMYDKYHEALFEYRMNPDTIMLETNPSDEGIQEYTEKAYEFMQNPKCANISMPYVTTYTNGESNIDAKYFEKIMRAYAKKSFETGFNMFAKSVCYIGIIDEPQQNGLFNRVKVVANTYRATINLVAESLEKDSSITSPIKAEVIQGIRNLRNVVTSSYESAIADSVDTWCPQFQHYDSDIERRNYDSQEEKWWYGCVSPRAPYPTYHTDDTLLSARLVSWMQAEYNVKGNLFWATDVYARYNGKVYVDIDEYYEGNASRFPQVNGDGYLFYPGKKYGIDGPIGSLRLEAIRDGIEEYELLIALEEQYEEMNEKLSAENKIEAQLLYDSLSEFVYNGTKVAASDATFAAARESLLQLSVLGQSDAELALAGYSDNGYGVKEYKFVATKGTTMKNNGTAVTGATEDGDYFVYTVSTELKNDSNTLNLTVENGGKTYEFTQELGGKVVVRTVSEANIADITKETVKPEATIVSEGFETDHLKIALPTVAEGEQSFRLGGALVAGVNAATSKVVLHIYYDGEDLPEVIVSGKYTGSRIYGDIGSFELKKGMNTIELSFGSKNWDKLGSLDYLCFIFSDGTQARTLYLRDCIVYGK